MKVRFSLLRWSYGGRRPKLEEKSVIVDAESYVDARYNVIPAEYPGWEISMAWPVWPEEEKT